MIPPPTKKRRNIMIKRTVDDLYDVTVNNRVRFCAATHYNLTYDEVVLLLDVYKKKYPNKRVYLEQFEYNPASRLDIVVEA